MKSFRLRKNQKLHRTRSSGETIRDLLPLLLGRAPEQGRIVLRHGRTFDRNVPDRFAVWPTPSDLAVRGLEGMEAATAASEKTHERRGRDYGGWIGQSGAHCGVDDGKPLL